MKKQGSYFEVFPKSKHLPLALRGQYYKKMSTGTCLACSIRDDVLRTYMYTVIDR